MLVVGAVWAALGCAATRPTTHSVAIRGFEYGPAVITAQVGDTVEWANGDIVPHTATAGGRRFDSGSVGSGRSWRYVTERAGTYDYVCEFHPNMKGTVVVR